MKKLAVWMLGLASLVAMTACNDDDRESVKVPAAVQGVFGEMYPGATHVEWSDRGGYMVADFRDGGAGMQAWFDAAGKWYMTEQDVPYAQLPEAVRTAFESGDYAAWQVDDVDKLMREGLETVYVLEVERGKEEFDLWYSADGVLLRAVPDTDGDDDREGMLPQELPQAVRDFIAGKYPGARIADAEREKGTLEVEIIDGRTPREVCFGTGDAWLWTKTEVRSSGLPAAVIAALAGSQYANWKIDDADHYDSPDGEWYLLELEEPQSEREAELRILPDGTIL